MIEWVEWRARQTPAPGGSYNVGKALDKVECKSKGTRLGKTNIGKRYVELLVEPRARQTPGPGAYETTKCLEKLGVTCLKEGGGFSMSGRPSLGQLPGRFASLSSNSFSDIDIRLEQVWTETRTRDTSSCACHGMLTAVPGWCPAPDSRPTTPKC